MFYARTMLVTALLSAAPLVAHAAPPIVPPEGPVWKVDGDFAFADEPDKKRESVSGIACPPPTASPRRCVVAFDEGHESRYVVIEGNRLVAEPDRIALVPGVAELDAEAAARIGDTVYISGSHSPKRKSCDPNPGSRHVVRFKVDPAGKSKLDAGGKPEGLQDDQGRLWALLGSNPVLKDFVGDGKCLGKPDHAVNIEGLAAKGDTLYFGFREPARNKQAYVLPVKADQLFAGSAAPVLPVTFELGSGLGFRDLLAVPEGILLLIGPDDDAEDGNWSMGFWDGTAAPGAVVAPNILAALDLRNVEPQPCKPPKDGKKAHVKPEAFTMLEDGTNFRRLLVLSDGMCDGGPLSFKIQK
jgi:hypothetical protein